MDLEQNYYVNKRPEIMKDLEKNIGVFRKILLLQLEEKKVETIEKETRDEYDALLPLIPYVGGDENGVTKDLINTTLGLAFSKIMKKYGYSTEEIAVFLFEIIEENFKSVSKIKKFMTRTLVTLFFIFPLNRIYKRKLKKLAQKSQDGLFSPNLVVQYVEGDGKEFDVGIDYLACPILNFWREQGVEEIVPYLCLYDYFSSEFTGTGLVRTMTLAEGFEKCDFRLKKGRKPENRQKTQILTRESLS